MSLTRIFPCALMVSITAFVAQAAPTFQGLGSLPGAPGSTATAISADGLVVCGASGPMFTEHAFRWSRTGGMQDLGTLPFSTRSSATSINADGSVIAGFSFQPEYFTRAFRWSTGTGLQQFADSTGSNSVVAHGMDASGSVSVGATASTSDDAPAIVRAVKWTEPGGQQSILLDSHFASATAISADGSAIAGLEGPNVFRLTSAGRDDLGDLGLATALSYDGSIVVGYHTGSDDSEYDLDFAWAWRQQQLTVLFAGQARAVSADGSAIAGAFTDKSGFPAAAVLWTPALGAVDLNLYLPQLGIELAGWQLREATGISADGSTIVGTGRNPSGQSEGWIAVIPEPTSHSLAALCAGFLGTCRRCRRWGMEAR